MPYSSVVDAGLDIVLITARGELPPESLLACIREYHAHPNFHPEIDIIFDLQTNLADKFAGVLNGEVPLGGSFEEAGRRVRSVRGEHTYRVACAGGTPRDQHFFMAAIDLLNERPEKAAFDTIFEARDWLQS